MCKLLRMSLLCLLLLFMFCTSVSFGYMSSTTASEVNSNLYKLYEHGVINFQAYNLTSQRINEWTSNSSYSSFTDNYAIVIGKGNTYPNFKSTITTYLSLSVLNFASNSDIINRSSSSTNAFYHDWTTSYGSSIKGGTLVGVTTNSNSLPSGALASDQILQQYLYFYSPTNNLRTRLYSVDKGVEYGGTYLTTPKLTYNNFKTSTISVNYNGNSDNFIKADYDKSLSSWRLGYLSNFDTSGAYEVHGQLQAYVGSDNLGALWGQSVGSFTYKRGVGIYNNGLALTDTSQHDIYVSSDLILYNQGYCLFFDAYDDNGNQLQVDNMYTYLYFVPLGDTSTSGDLINPNLNNELDWSFINSIQYLNDSSSGNTQYIVNSSLSQFFSGDIGYVAPSDSQTHYGFLHQMFVDLIDLLQVNSTTSSITINVHGYNNTFYAADFITPNNSIKTFAQLFLIVGCFFLLYQQFMAIYFALLTLDIHTFVKSQDVDFTFFM